MNHTEKVARRLKTQAAIAEVSSVRLRQAGDYANAEDWIRMSRELYNIINLLTAPIGQQGEPVDIVFDGPPGPEAGRFVEVESPPGRSIRFGEWVERDDGYWVLRIHPPASREREALEEVVTFVKECATPPYPNSNAVSLLEWVEGRASYLLRNNAMLAQEADDGK